MDPKNHIKGMPALGEFILPKIEPDEVAAIFLGAIDAAKERQMKQVMAILDELRGKDGCVAVEVLKRALAERVR